MPNKKRDFMQAGKGKKAAYVEGKKPGEITSKDPLDFLPKDQKQFDAMMGVTLAMVGAKARIEDDEVTQLFSLMMWCAWAYHEVMERGLFDIRKVDGVELCKMMGVDKDLYEKLGKIYKGTIQQSDSVYGKEGRNAQDAWRFIYGEDINDEEEDDK